MRRRRGVLLAVVVLVFGGACGSNDGDDAEAFELSGRVVSVEPAAQPADPPEGADIVGAIVVQTSAPEDCETDADGVRVYLSESTTVTPSSASDDLDALRGKTVSVSGGVTKDGSECTAIADRVTAAAADARPTGTDADTSGPTTGGAQTSPSSNDDADATSSPNHPDDEGYISDTEETASPAPEDPNEEGVVPQP